MNQFLWIVSNWIGEPMSPEDLSDTRLSTYNFVPPKTVIGTLFCALVTDDANLISSDEILIAKYTVFVSIFSGKSPSSLSNLTFYTFCIVCFPIFNILEFALLLE